MSTPLKARSGTVWDLPPLILHPLNERVAPASLLENSRAALMLSGLIPNEGVDPDELQQRILAGRYSEIRMLFFLGKDVFRWIEQCLESIQRIPELSGSGISSQSFAALLTSSTPEPVKHKLSGWGVADHYAIFSRGIGLNSLFSDPPEFCCLATEFLRNYHRYSDSAYQCFIDGGPRVPVSPANFHFALYASGEYSQILASQWCSD